MAKPSLAYLFTAFVFLSVSTSSAQPPNPPLSDTFLSCLTQHANSSTPHSNIVFDNTNPNFTTVLPNYIARLNTPLTPKPLLIVTVLQESHVQATVICAKSTNVQLRIRSGGHDYEGLSYVSQNPFILLDMFNLHRITVDVKNEVAMGQASATLGEVYYRIWDSSKVHGFPASVCPIVAVGGHISGGGYGNMLRKYGLSVDNVIDAQIVDVKGNLLNRQTMGDDLFWAIRGGRVASFGVVVLFTIKIVPVPETVTFFRVDKTLEENATDLVLLFMRLLLAPSGKTVRASVMALFLGEANEVLPILEKEFPLLGLKKVNCTEAHWIDSVAWFNDDQGSKNGAKPETLLVRQLNYNANPREGLEIIWKKMIELGEMGLVFNPYRGKMAQIPSDATPFPHRKGNLFKARYSVSWKDPSPAAAQNFLNQTRELHSCMTPYVSKNPRSAFLNYRDLDIGVNSFGKNSFQEVYGAKYFNDNLQRLVKVKTAVDPENFFRNEQSIPAGQLEDE
ncbi:hypothetical protein AAZV13_15G123500 [Glycine max]